MTVYKRRLPWSATPHPLGRHVEHDSQSRAFPARTTALPNTPIVWKLNAARLDQGNLGSCVPNAASQCMNTTPYYPERRKLSKGRFLTEAQAIDWYRTVTARDEFPGQWEPDDTGSSGLAIAKVLKDLGWITEYTHAFGIDHLLRSLPLGPLIVGTAWLEDMFYPDERGVVSVSGSIAGGHEYLSRIWIPAGHRIFGHRWTKDMLGFSNSWGDWGRNGDFLIPVDEFADLLYLDGDATKLVGAVA